MNTTFFMPAAFICLTAAAVSLQYFGAIPPQARKNVGTFGA